MEIIDFEYDGKLVSEFGLKFAGFDLDSVGTVEVGSKISINKVKGSNSDKYYSTGYSYEEYTPTFKLIKLDCKQNDLVVISPIEFNYIMRWLNRKGYFKFVPIYDDSELSGTYYMGTFNVNPVVVGTDIIGLELTFMSNAPYGYSGDFTHRFRFDGKNTLMISDNSDEIGFTYCKCKITLLESGDLKFANDYDNNPIVIKNCTKGEIITLDGINKIILSDKAHTTLPNDFNYNYIRLTNSFNERKNVFHSNLKCNIEITYSPIRKVGIIC